MGQTGVSFPGTELFLDRVQKLYDSIFHQSKVLALPLENTGYISTGCSDGSYHRTAMGALQRGVSWKEGHSHPADVAPRQVPFSIFTATVVYPARPLRRKAVALTTFPNSPSPRVFPRTKLFRGNSHFGSSCVRMEMGPLVEKGERSDG